MQMITTYTESGRKSFSLMPISVNCPFVAGEFNPVRKTLTLLGLHTYDTYRLIPKVDPKGKPTPSLFDRELINTNFSYEIVDKQEMTEVLADITNITLEKINAILEEYHTLYEEEEKIKDQAPGL